MLLWDVMFFYRISVNLSCNGFIGYVVWFLVVLGVFLYILFLVFVCMFLGIGYLLFFEVIMLYRVRR